MSSKFLIFEKRRDFKLNSDSSSKASKELSNNEDLTNQSEESEQEEKKSTFKNFHIMNKISYIKQGS